VPRDFATDAALRPQPRRDGPDAWATPPSLCIALTGGSCRYCRQARSGNAPPVPACWPMPCARRDAR
jgi:hypothetical protein